MSGILVDRSLCTLCGACESTCPFGAISLTDDGVSINAACKICKLCIKNCPVGALSLDQGKTKELDRDAYRGIMVVAELDGDRFHSVTLELLGEGRKLADKVGHPLFCAICGENVGELAESLRWYGVDKVFVYDHPALAVPLPETYSNVFSDCIRTVSPAVVLVGATPVGRSLAPRLSCRFRTGLTADCTELDIRENTDLVQIRPAFGGNIMAQIVTPRTRPQFATVRPKVLDAAPRREAPAGEIVSCTVKEEFLRCGAQVLSLEQKPKTVNISECDVLVAVGRGFKSKKDLEMAKELADLLGGEIACTRPLIESGWCEYPRQIGLSGRTVKPKLIIALGISGAIQFVAGMNSSETIIAINSDPDASIFKTAHYGVVGDLYEILPRLIESIKEGRGLHV